MVGVQAAHNHLWRVAVAALPAQDALAGLVLDVAAGLAAHRCLTLVPDG